MGKKLFRIAKRRWKLIKEVNRMKKCNKSEKEKINEIVYRIERFSDRFENIKELKNAKFAKKTSQSIRNCTNLNKAYDIEKEFIHQIKEKIKCIKENIEAESSFS